MPSSFTEWLLLTLVALLFGKDNLLPAILRKFGMKDTEERRYRQQEQIDDLEKHAVVANEEMGQVVERLGSIDSRLGNVEKDVAFIRGQLSK